MRCLAVALLLLSSPAAALELIWRESFDFPRPASLAFDTETCSLWVVNESRTVTQLALTGQELARFDSDFFGVRAIGVEPEGLVLVSTDGRFARVGRDGTPRGAPLDFSVPTPDVEGLEITPEGDLWVIGDDPSYLALFDRTGALITRHDGLGLEPPLSEPQGVAIDPFNGNLLITDDWEGENALFEFTPAGAFVSMVPLIQHGTDPEGIAVHAQTGTLWVAFDQGQRIAVFDYLPSPGTPRDQGPDCALM